MDIRGEMYANHIYIGLSSEELKLFIHINQPLKKQNV